MFSAGGDKQGKMQVSALLSGGENTSLIWWEIYMVKRVLKSTKNAQAFLLDCEVSVCHWGQLV